MASSTLPRRPTHGTQIRADRTRDTVIAETIRCIHEEGFATASARHIVKRAGVTWGVIHYHFGDRDGLLSAVVDRAFGELLGQLDNIVGESADMTTRRRTQFVVAAVWAVLSSPNSLAAMEIVIATRTIRDSLATTHLDELHKTFTTLAQHLGPGLTNRQGRELGDLIWTTLRALIVVQLTVTEPFDASRELQALVEVIAAYVESNQSPQPDRARRGARPASASR